MNFSHSAIDEYKTCPRKYYLNRVIKLRPIYTKSPLLFGSALDDVTGRLLLTKKSKLTEDEKESLNLSAMEIYNLHQDKWKKDENCRFSASDLDFSLFLAEDLDYCFKFCQELNLDVSEDNYKAFIDSCKQQVKKDILALDFETQLGYNIFAIKSLEKKTELFIPIIQEWIENNVVEVHDIQRRIELIDGEDMIRGYIDFSATTKDGVRRTWDFKTSSKAYAEDSAETSQQLTIYSEAEQNPEVGFLVVQKSIRKREPRVRLQEVTGTITPEQNEDIFSGITEIVDIIKNSDGEEDFEKNLGSCYKFGICEWYGYCKNNNDAGLEFKK